MISFLKKHLYTKKCLVLAFIPPFCMVYILLFFLTAERGNFFLAMISTVVPGAVAAVLFSFVPAPYSWIITVALVILFSYASYRGLCAGLSDTRATNKRLLIRGGVLVLIIVLFLVFLPRKDRTLVAETGKMLNAIIDGNEAVWDGERNPNARGQLEDLESYTEQLEVDGIRLDGEVQIKRQLTYSYSGTRSEYTKTGSYLCTVGAERYIVTITYLGKGEYGYVEELQIQAWSEEAYSGIMFTGKRR